MVHYYYLIGCLIAGILFLTAILAKSKSRNFRILMLILGDVVIIGSELFHRSEYYQMQSVKDLGNPVVTNSFIILIVILIIVNVAVKKLIFGKTKNP
jgi:hypothetical protein